ncbi:MAG: helix-turn-helix domain-containing protein [Oscillospiraceae bacterium]|nr:helix-turn-helix domain-containing protein [Oscillospiraceae bacterium]
MDTIKTGKLIRELRLEKGLTQKALSEMLCVSDKTISKWERGFGWPDPSVWNNLSSILGVGIDSMLNGDMEVSKPIGGNMKKSKYYVCPLCGNVLVSTGDAGIVCCGRKLEPLQAKKAAEDEKLTIEMVEDDWFITSDHPMTKDNYISFIAFATGDQIHIYKQYPEWNLQTRIQKRRHGTLLWYSTTQGFFYQLI